MTATLTATLLILLKVAVAGIILAIGMDWCR